MQKSGIYIKGSWIEDGFESLAERPIERAPCSTLRLQRPPLKMKNSVREACYIQSNWGTCSVLQDPCPKKTAWRRLSSNRWMVSEKRLLQSVKADWTTKSWSNNTAISKVALSELLRGAGENVTGKFVSHCISPYLLIKICNNSHFSVTGGGSI